MCLLKKYINYFPQNISAFTIKLKWNIEIERNYYIFPPFSNDKTSRPPQFRAAYALAELMSHLMLVAEARPACYMLSTYSSPPLIRPPCLPMNYGHIRKVALVRRRSKCIHFSSTPKNICHIREGGLCLRGATNRGTTVVDLWSLLLVYNTNLYNIYSILVPM